MYIFEAWWPDLENILQDRGVVEVYNIEESGLFYKTPTKKSLCFEDIILDTGQSCTKTE